jgi:hypothetical protein
VAEATQSNSGPGISLSSCLLIFIVFAAAILALHSHYLRLPYFWDEMGQFVPTALDIERDGAWVPHSATPNVHPPGIMAYLALAWSIAGRSILTTRVAMLLIAALGMLFVFLLTVELCPGLRGPPAFLVVALLLVSPLFFTQAMLAQLDMAAMALTTLALMLFLQQRYTAAAWVCTLIVLVKETCVIAPGLFLLWLVFRERKFREACFFLVPLAALVTWLFVLKHGTGRWLGDSQFVNFNVAYSLHPVRAASALLRRIYYLFVAEFRWVGTTAVIFALSKSHVFSTARWQVVGLFAALHVAVVSLFGGAELERYVLPVLPLLYVSFVAAWSLYTPVWRRISILVLVIGLIAGMFWNSPFPGPLEDNLAMIDFVNLQKSAADFLDEHPPHGVVVSAWPFTQAVSDPLFGYVHRPLQTVDTVNFHSSRVIAAINPSKTGAFVIYSRTWEPRWRVLRWPPIIAFLQRFYDYEPQIGDAEIRARFGFIPAARWDLHGQWIEIYLTAYP